MPAITKNEIKHLTALKIKKYRYSHGQFVVEGPKVTEEFIRAGHNPEKVYGNEIPERLKELVPASKLISVTEQELKKISSFQTPNIVLAIFTIPENTTPPKPQKWVIALDDIRDPGNLGTIIRIADWFGFEAVICSEECADVYNPKTIQSSMGSLARVPVFTCRLQDYFMQNEDVPVFGTLLEGESYSGLEYPSRGIVLIGNESKGIDPALISYITHAITIPRIGQAESLNAAVATAVVCAEISRR